MLYPVSGLIAWLNKRLRATESLPAGATRLVTGLDMLLPVEKLRYLIMLLSEIERAFDGSADD